MHVSAPAAAAPCGVGPYTNLTLHASGGLGEVLKAVDPQLHRTVAVKRLHDCHADNADSQRRFLLEAEITAQLEHPGVVPVYALLRDDCSQPCYAMRFIEGQTLAEAISDYHEGAANAVAFRRLLQCFLQMCQTVAYAHSRGVIHRDLKPGNVMLGKFGETLVVDWGLAKAVGRPDEVRATSVETTLQLAEAATGEKTSFGSVVGTPAYMSPEQAAGRLDIVNTASDIYSLGAVLYTLLAGQPPLTRGNWPELSQKIQRGDFPRPQEINPAVPLALQAICAQAMALEPFDRYASAQALAADVEHWLADEPVSAWQEPLRIRSGRWMRRHRSLVGAGMILLLTILAGAAVGLVLLNRKNQEVAAERNAARSAAGQAQAVNAFLLEDLLGQADPEINDRTKQLTVEELLHRAARKIENNPKFHGQPEVEATLQQTIGKTFHKLGNFAEAEKHLRRALDLRRQAFGADDLRTLATQEALADFLNLGPGRSADAVVLARQTWEARTRVLGPQHRDTLDSLDTYATALYLAGQIAEASTHHQQCLTTRKRVLGHDHPDTIVSMNNLALTLLKHGKSEQAIALLREVEAICGSRFQGRDYAIHCLNLAMALHAKGDLDGADKLLQESLERSVKQFGAEHPVPDRLQGALVRVWIDQGRLQAAVLLGQKVVARRQRIYPANHGLTAETLIEVGRGLALLGRHTEASVVLDEARKIHVAAPPVWPWCIAWAECWRGANLTGLRRFAEAEPLLLAAERKLRAIRGPASRDARDAAQQLANLYDAWGRPAQAATWRKQTD